MLACRQNDIAKLIDEFPEELHKLVPLHKRNYRLDKFSCIHKIRGDFITKLHKKLKLNCKSEIDRKLSINTVLNLLIGTQI